MAGGYDGEIRIRTLIENGKASSQLLQLEAKFQKLTSEAKKLSDGMREIEQMKIPTEEYKNLQGQFDALVAKGKKLSEELKNTEKFVPSKPYLEAEKALDSVSAKQDHLRKKMEEWVALGKKTNSVSYKKMEMDFETLGQQADRLIMRLNEMDENGSNREISDKWKNIKDQMAQAGAEASKVKAQMRDMESDGTANVDPKSTAEYQKKAEKLKEVNRQLDVTKRKMEEVAAKEAKVGTGSKNIEKVGKAAKKSAGLMSTLLSRLKGITLSLFVFNWITKGFNAMVAAFKEGIQNMAKHSGDFNSKMSEMKSATATLKASLGALAAPIVSAVVPAIVTLCNWLTTAVNKINMFISALCGKSTWTRAKKQQVDYAKSLNSTAAAAKKAARALQGFDELNVINSNSDSDSGKTGNDAEFEEVALTEKDFAWVKRIKKAFESILPVVVAIGAALLAWKIASFLTDLMKVNPLLGTILSVIAVIAGLVLAVVNYFHMWNEGVDWQGLIGYIVGVALAFGGLYALFGPFVAGIFLIIASVAGFILALKDISENGLNAKNTTLLLVSALGLVAGVFMTLGATAAVIVTGLLLISAGIADVMQNGVNLKNGLLIVSGVFLSVAAVAGATVGAIAALIAGLVLAVAADWDNFKKTVWEPIKKWFKEMWSNFVESGEGFKKMLDGIVKFISGVFSGDWEKAWEGIKEIFGGAWDGIVGLLKASANLIIGILNTVYNFVCGVVNAIINGINKISFTTPDWLNYLHDGWGGQTFGGFNLQPIQPIDIPYLANGGITTGSTLANIGEAGREAVLPLENNLGYLEPLADMIASKMEGVQTVRVVPDKSNIFKVVREEANGYYRRTGNPAFDF